MAVSTKLHEHILDTCKALYKRWRCPQSSMNTFWTHVKLYIKEKRRYQISGMTRFWNHLHQVRTKPKV